MTAPDDAYAKYLKHSIRRGEVAWDAVLGWYFDPVFHFVLEDRAQTLLRDWCRDGVITVDETGKVKLK